jgi:Pyridine nucleotide-disulphide oxidoreductase
MPLLPARCRVTVTGALWYGADYGLVNVETAHPPGEPAVAGAGRADAGVRAAAVLQPGRAVLLDRERERGQIDGVLETTRQGRSAALVLVGEPGSGKTTLLDYAVESGQDFEVIRLLGIESETELGFAALYQLRLPFQARLRYLPAPQRDALAGALGLRRADSPDRFLLSVAPVPARRHSLTSSRPCSWAYPRPACRRSCTARAVRTRPRTSSSRWAGPCRPRYYDSLTLFSPAGYSGLPGLDFPGDPDRYPHRDEVAAYLRRYAAELGADIRTGTPVTAVQADDQVGFLVHTATGQAWRAAGVVAATGSFGHPYQPVLPGQDRFTGRLLHVAGYRSPHPHAGERVVVVGAGNSAVQVGPGGTRERVDTVLFATGYRPDLDYLRPLGALGDDGMPRHAGGISATHPGLVYLGLEFQRSFSSNTLRGVHRDADHVIPALAAHVHGAPAAIGR